MRFFANEMIGDYRITAFLGAGGMGEVYLAVHSKLIRPAAIKVLLPDVLSEDFTTRFFNEARLQGRLHHPNIAALYDFQEINEQLFIFMEFVDGESLEDLIERRAFSVEESTKAFSSIVEAVAFIHQNGIVHRDIKAQNVKINHAGTVKLLDFGIAKDAASHKLTQIGGVIGTPHYLAPEQLSGQGADARTDIWSLGVLFYEMLTGKMPFESETLGELCAKITTGKFPAPEETNPAVPRGVSKIVARCLKKNPAERYQTTDEVLAAVRAVNSEDDNRIIEYLKNPFRFLTWMEASKFSPLAFISLVSGVSVVVLFAVISLIMWTKSGSTENPPATVSGQNNSNRNVIVYKPNPTNSPSDEMLRIEVTVTPREAKIFRDGQLVAEGTYIFQARNGEKVNLKLSLEGHKDQLEPLEITHRDKEYDFAFTENSALKNF